MIVLPQDTYTRVERDDGVWVIIQSITANIVLAVREVDINGGAESVTVSLLEI